ncbi:MAG: hypothetical protein LBS64_04475 [Spirochaetaceae bacterium]|jgi:outer membrane protein assembly factor BamD (BamD/ComL family)|nr:hypothetical protein [Spirochaetaceae bacterium]
MNKLLALCLFCLVIAACKSVPTEDSIPEDTSVAELVQLAQTSYDGGNSAASEVYYRVIQKRYYDDLPVRLAAEFEIAHIKIKQKNWSEAKPLLEQVLSYYEGMQAYTLPSAYYKLTQIDLKKIPQ